LPSSSTGFTDALTERLPDIIRKGYFNFFKTGEEIMNDQMPPTVEPKKSNTTLIVAVVAVVLLCCCCIGIAALWQYGDVIMQNLGM
jgi:hypothetical protein